MSETLSAESAGTASGILGPGFWQSLRHLLAGSLSGVGCLIAGHPFDLVKVRLQSEVGHAAGTPLKYTGAIDCFKQTIRNEGFLALYKGTLPTLTSMVAENAILFLAYGNVKSFLQKMQKDKEKELGMFQLGVAGGLASVFSSFTTCPTELVKCRLQVQGEPGRPVLYKGAMHCTTSILKSEGIRGLYRGLGGTLIREVPGNMAFFWGYEGTRKALAHFTNKRVEELGTWELLTAGGIGGVSFWLLVFPFDTVKSIIQTESLASGGRMTFLGELKKLYRNGGTKALYRGSGITLFRAFPANAALFVTYEYAYNAMS